MAVATEMEASRTFDSHLLLSAVYLLIVALNNEAVVVGPLSITGPCPRTAWSITRVSGSAETRDKLALTPRTQIPVYTHELRVCGAGQATSQKRIWESH